MITSCSPGWINYIEGFHPDLLEHLSTCKSPQQMFGALSKNYPSGCIGGGGQPISSTKKIVTKCI